MQFLAQIRKDSAVHRLWQGTSRLGGHVRDVPFRWSPNEKLFVATRPLTAEEYTLLRNHDSVQVAVITEPVGKAKIAEPPPKPADPPKPVEPPSDDGRRRPRAKG